VGVGVLAFQNCAKVNFEAVPTEQASQGNGDSGVRVVQKADLTAGSSKVPDLKMMFVVDNSFTMKANQIKLGESFDKMFSASNQSNLVPFSTTAYVFSTAQSSPELSATTLTPSGDLAAMLNNQKSISELSSLSLQQLESLHRGHPLSGAIPGDIVGYRAYKQDSVLPVYLFRPEPVYGFRSLGPSGVVSSAGIGKAAFEDASRLANEFKNRISILDPTRFSVNNYQDIVDSESAMCGMARILRHNANFLSANDLAAFILVSDENESDLDGSRCIDSYAAFDGRSDLIQGRCEERSTKVDYSYPLTTTTPGTCVIRFDEGYRVRYTYKQARITYPIGVFNFTVPRTNVSYYRVASQQYKQTSLSFFTKTCVYRDGVVASCTYNPVTAVIDRDRTANCRDAVLAANSQAVVNEPQYPFACAPAAPKNVNSCTVTDSDCLTTFAASAAVVDGAIGAGASCDSRARSLGGYVDAQRVASCTAAQAEVRASCPGGVTCTRNQTGFNTRTITVDVPADFFSASANCTARAAQQSDYLTGNGATPVSCTATSDGSVARDYAFTSAYGPGSNTVGSACSAALRNEVVRNMTAKDGTCTIESMDIGQSNPIPKTNGLTCAQAALTHCSSSNPIRSACVIAAETQDSTVTNTVNRSFVVKEDILGSGGSNACDIVCGNSVTNACANVDIPAAVSPVVPAASNMTLGAYITSRGGTACSVSRQGNPVTKSTFVDELASEQGQLCQAPVGAKYYTVVDGLPYRKKGLKTEYVTGTLLDGQGNSIPRLSLPVYIRTRAEELFGKNSPVLSVFVRRQGDSVGAGGSLGTSYEELADSMSGIKQSILIPDYSPALVQLGQVIRERLERSFSVPGFKEGMQVLEVYHMPAGATDWVEVPKSKWNASGSAVTLDPSYTFAIGDKFRIVFW